MHRPDTATIELIDAVADDGSAADTTVIGDTMDTDIQGGVQMGYKTILVLSGVARREELGWFAFKPDLIVESVNEIQLPLPWWEKKI